jgi:hypothetical protein
MNLQVPWKVEISRIIEWLLTSQGLSCMELVSRLFMPLKENMFSCWKFGTHIDDSCAGDFKTGGSRREVNWCTKWLFVEPCSCKRTPNTLLCCGSPVYDAGRLPACLLCVSVNLQAQFLRRHMCSGFLLTWFWIFNSNMEKFCSWLFMVLSSYCMSILFMLLHAAVNLIVFYSYFSINYYQFICM